MNALFPIFIKANQVNILLVGGGNVAEEKLHFLLKSSPEANVKIVAKELGEKVSSIAKEFDLPVEERPFLNRDIKDVHLIIAATNNNELNNHIRSLATQNNVLLNVADKSQLCDYYLGGVVTKGDLKLAISTNGKSPIMAKRLRQFFENELPEGLDEVIDELQNLRQTLKGSFERKLETLNTLTKELINESN